MEFRKNSLTVSSTLDALEVAQIELIALTLNPGKHLQRFIDNIHAENDVHTYQGTILDNYANIKNQDLHADIIEDIQDHLSRRLETERDAVLKAARVFDPSEWPLNRAELAGYGLDQINIMLNQFSQLLERNNIDADEVRAAQWLQLKPTSTTWEIMAESQYGASMACRRDILSLHEIATVIPCSSAICGRGFSCLKRIKQDW